MEIICTNVNRALSECLQWLAAAGVEENSRNGPVIVSPEPVLVTHTRPTERVLFSPLRDANPWFHFFESLHMLAGRSDIAFLTYFNKQFINYSDDGVTQWGAYGARWRTWFGYDQLTVIAEELRRNPESRRCVLAMWDATGLGQPGDLHKAVAGGKDVPCNTQAYFDRRGGALNMTVTNRSNDLIWGMCGANVVHFSMLQEYLAAAVGCPVGQYRQFTNNLHAYVAVAGNRERMRQLAVNAEANDVYLNKGVRPFPLVRNFNNWDGELSLFFNNPLRRAGDYTEPFFATVAAPAYAAWHARRELGLNGADAAARILAEDWRTACEQWIGRRVARKAATTNA